MSTASSERKRLERQHKAQLARIAKADAQESILKWIELAAQKRYRGIHTRPVLSWACVRECQGKPALAASDGYRVQIAWIGVDGLPEWVRLKDSSERDETSIYPDYELHIPKEMQTIQVNVAEFIHAAKCAQIFARDSAQCVTFDCDPEKRVMRVSGYSRDKGEVTTYVEVCGNGSPFKVCLNVQYVLDALKIWQQHDTVPIETGNPKEPVIIGQRGYKMALIMPMSKNR